MASLLILVPVLTVLCSEDLFCAHDFKGIPHFLFSVQVLSVQHIWFYIESFDPFGGEYCKELSMDGFGIFYMQLPSFISSIY